MESITINEKDLPLEAKQLITKIRYSSQEKIDELQQELDDKKKPVTITKAKFILT